MSQGGSEKGIGTEEDIFWGTDLNTLRDVEIPNAAAAKLHEYGEAISNNWKGYESVKEYGELA